MYATSIISVMSAKHSPRRYGLQTAGQRSVARQRSVVWETLCRSKSAYGVEQLNEEAYRIRRFGASVWRLSLEIPRSATKREGAMGFMLDFVLRNGNSFAGLCSLKTALS